MDGKSNFGESLFGGLLCVLLCMTFCLFSGCDETLINENPKGPTEGFTETIDVDVVGPAMTEGTATAKTETRIVGGVDSNESSVAAVLKTEMVESPKESPEVKIGAKSDAAVKTEEATTPPEKIGLKEPVPAETVEMIGIKEDAGANLDNMYTAAVSYLGDQGQGPLATVNQATENGLLSETKVEVTDKSTAEVVSDKVEPAEEAEDATEEGAGKRSFRNFFPVIGGAVVGFARRHFLLIGFGVVFVVAVISVRRKGKGLAFPWRKRKG